MGTSMTRFGIKVFRVVCFLLGNSPASEVYIIIYIMGYHMAKITEPSLTCHTPS